MDLCSIARNRYCGSPFLFSVPEDSLWGGEYDYAGTSGELENNTSHVEQTRTIWQSDECHSFSAQRQLSLKNISEEFYRNSMIETETQPIDFCRICREDESKERLLSPCQCKGTMAFVHVSCLERWLVEADSCRCELCGHRYMVVKTSKYGMLKSIFVWVRYHSPRELLMDTLKSCGIISLAAFGTYIGYLICEKEESPFPTIRIKYSSERILGIMATDLYDEIEESGRSDAKAVGTKIASLGVVIVMTLLNMYSLTWFISKTHHYSTLWYAWWRRDVRVRRLVLPPEVMESRPTENRNEEQSEQPSDTNQSSSK